MQNPLGARELQGISEAVACDTLISVILVVGHLDRDRVWTILFCNVALRFLTGSPRRLLVFANGRDLAHIFLAALKLLQFLGVEL